VTAPIVTIMLFWIFLRSMDDGRIELFFLFFSHAVFSVGGLHCEVKGSVAWQDRYIIMLPSVY
jgi:hypothetical protein